MEDGCLQNPCFFNLPQSTQKFFSSKTLLRIIWCQPNANPRSSLLLLPNPQQPPTPSTALQVSISLQQRSKDCWRVSSLSCQITPSGLAAPLISSEAGQIISAPTKLNPYPAAATDCTALRQYSEYSFPWRTGLTRVSICAVCLSLLQHCRRDFIGRKGQICSVLYRN